MKKEGYIYLFYNKDSRLHYLYNKDSQIVEHFAARKNFAGWSLKYKNTDLEFCSSEHPEYTKRFIDGLRKIQHFGEQHPGFKRAHKLLKQMTA